ncbi:galactoside permease [compost metagenome]
MGLGSYIGIDFAFSPYLTSLTGDTTLSNQIFSISTGFKVFLEFATFTVLGVYFKSYDVKKALILVFMITAIRFLCISSGMLPIVVFGDQLHGIAFPLFLVTVFKYLRQWVSEDLVPSCYGIVSMLIFGISNFVYPPLFASIQSSAGYTVMYGINVVLSMLTILIGVLMLPKMSMTNREREAV